MASPREQILLVDGSGSLIPIDQLVKDLREDASRVLADDEVGLVIYVGDLDLYELTPIETGEYVARPIIQISSPRFPVRTLRKQIGARVFSVTADAVFIVRENNSLKKLRAEQLTPGMELASGEKVFK